MMGTNWVASTAALALDITLGATLVLALAALAAFTVLYRAPAAARHLAWLCALGTVLVLPLASLAVPEWRWEVRSPAAAAASLSPAVAPLADSEPQVQVTPVRAAQKPAAPASPLAPAPNAPRQTVVPTPAVSPTPAPSSTPTLPTVLLALWGLGAALVLLRFGARLQTLHRFAARCAPYPDAATLELLDEAAARLSASPGIHLLQAPADHLPTGPMTWGVQQPVVVLPPGALLWPPARMRSVLLHEVAHVRRRDWAGYLVANVACAVYWFHPLVWWAAARLRAESELACDDQVLRAGIPPTEYAHALVEIIKALRGPAGGLKVAISMAQGPQIEQRLRAILDPRRRRGALSPAGLTAAVVLSVAVAVPAAGVRVRPAGAAGGTEPETSSDAMDTPAAAPRDSRVAWGQPVGGLRAGLEWAAWNQDVRPGESLALRVRVRNTGLKPVRLSCLKPSAWDARLDATGRVTLTPMLQGGGAVPAAAIWLAPGKECFVPGAGPQLRIAPRNEAGSAEAGETVTLSAGRYQVVAARPLMLQGASATAGSLYTGRLPLQVLSAAGGAEVSPTHRVSQAVDTGTVPASRSKPVRPVATAVAPAPEIRPATPLSGKAKAQQQALRARVYQLQQRIAELEDDIAELRARQENSTSAVLIRRLEERIAETEEQLIVTENQSRPDSEQVQSQRQLLRALEERLANLKGELRVRGDETTGERRKRQAQILALKLQLAEAEDELAALGRPAPKAASQLRPQPVSDVQVAAQHERLAKFRAELLAAEVQLAELRTRYGEQHPRIKVLQDRIAALQAQRDSVLAEARTPSPPRSESEADLMVRRRILEKQIQISEALYAKARADKAGPGVLNDLRAEIIAATERLKAIIQQQVRRK